MGKMLVTLVCLLLTLTGCKASETHYMSSNRIPHTDDELVRLDMKNGQSIFATDLRYEMESVGRVTAGDSLWFSVVAIAPLSRGRDDWPTTTLRVYRRYGQALPRQGVSRQDLLSVTYRRVDPLATLRAIGVGGAVVAAIYMYVVLGTLEN